MTEAPQKALYRRFVEEVINEGRLDVIPEIFSPAYVDHSAPPGAPTGGFAAIEGIPKLFRGAFPDVHFTIDDMALEGDWVASHVTGRASHLGRPFLGIEPTGLRAVWSSFGFFRVEDGRIVEHYGQPDMMGLHEQLSRTIEPGTLDHNRFVVARYVYATNIGELDRFDEFVDPSFVDHNALPGQAPGIEGLKAAYRMFSDAFSDLWYTFEALLADGDYVAGRGVIEGRHTGPFMGIPATGKTIRWTGTRTFRLRDGKVTDGWIDLDLFGMMMQLGAIPAPGSAPSNGAAAASSPTQANTGSEASASSAPSVSHADGGTPTMATDENKRIMQRMIDEVWNKGNLMAADELFAPDHTSPSAPDLPPGPESVKMLATMFRSAMPDYHMTIDLMMADENRVVARFTQSGTHTGAPLMGLPPSGRKATWTEIGILEVAGGKIRRSWYEVDMLSMMNQLNPQPA